MVVETKKFKVLIWSLACAAVFACAGNSPKCLGAAGEEGAAPSPDPFGMVLPAQDEDSTPPPDTPLDGEAEDSEDNKS